MAVLRWIAVPFAAIMGSILAYAIITLWIGENNFIYQFYTGSNVFSITQIVLSLAAQAAFGATFVFLGSVTAPNHQRICAIVLATVISMLSATSFIIASIMNGFSCWFLLHIIATIVGAIGSASQMLSNPDFAEAKY